MSGVCLNKTRVNLSVKSLLMLPKVTTLLGTPVRVNCSCKPTEKIRLRSSHRTMAVAGGLKLSTRERTVSSPFSEL